MEECSFDKIYKYLIENSSSDHYLKLEYIENRNNILYIL